MGLLFPFTPWKPRFGASTMAFYVYILTNKRNGTLYIGMTDDLVKRVWQHRNGIIRGFTHRYGIK
jgi:putative endonuclease